MEELYFVYFVKEQRRLLGLRLFEARHKAECQDSATIYWRRWASESRPRSTPWLLWMPSWIYRAAVSHGRKLTSFLFSNTLRISTQDSCSIALNLILCQIQYNSININVRRWRIRPRWRTALGQKTWCVLFISLGRGHVRWHLASWIMNPTRIRK